MNARTWVLESVNRQRRWLLIIMLGLLHAVMMVGPDHEWARALMISHFGVFLLWQPLWRGEAKLGASGAVFIVLAFGAVMLLLGWGLLAFWMGGLFALMGGRVFSFRVTWLRYFYLAALLYLLFTMLLWVVPEMFGHGAVDELTHMLMVYFMPSFLLAMALMPTEQEPPGGGKTIDFLYSVTLLLLLAVMVLSVFAIHTLTQLSFERSLLVAIFVIAGVMMVAGWLWSPRFGFAGLQQIFSSYLLSVGTPFEQWLAQLARDAEVEPNAASFLDRAMQRLTELPWLQGIAWRAPEGEGRLGKKTEHSLMYQSGPLHMELWTERLAGVTMTLHTRLLVQLVGRFYQAKRREAAMRQMARMQAIHETGARLTHDVKNLLQSLTTLTAAAQQDGREGDFRGLMQRQLPLLSQRLQLTLEKIKAPKQEVEAGDTAPVSEWWDNLCTRYESRGIRFTCSDGGDTRVPLDLFNSVAENLIENAVRKRATDPGVVVSVELRVDGGGLLFAVTDSGKPVPAQVAERLFQAVMSTEGGLGVGLYQAGRWAAQHGYRLRLAENRAGGVRFELTQEPA
ncbi:MAG: HAMP domain-containing sensor histidine kinase [Pseudomonadota bacterium]